MTFKTKGIILKRTNLGEADRILTIFTEKQGKIKAIAKGIRKTLSRLAGHLEPFCLVNLQIAEGRNLDIVTEAETIKCFIKLRGNLRATHQAYYLAEIIEKMTAEGEKHLAIFDLLEQVLEHLDNGKNKLLLSYFEINFLAESGFAPELYKCISCGRKLQPDENYFSFRQGGIVCARCFKANFDAKKITARAVKILRLFLKQRISVIQKIQTDKKLVQEIEEIASTYIEHIAQKEFKSKRFLEK